MVVVAGDGVSQCFCPCDVSNLVNVIQCTKVNECAHAKAETSTRLTRLVNNRLFRELNLRYFRL